MIRIRTACPQDASACLAIYAPYVTHTSITFETEVPTEEAFTDRIHATLAQYPYLVAEDEGRIIGYCYASPFKSRAAYAWSAETSIYIHPDHQGRGVGRMLYEQLELLLIKQHVHTLNACITYPNPQSIAFHEKMGYTLCAHFHRSGFKHGAWRDIVWMEKQLSSETPPLPFLPFSRLTGGIIE